MPARDHAGRGRPAQNRHLDIHGSLLDFNGACGCHKNLKLSMVIGIASVPTCADLWVAKDPYQLAQGLQIAECLQMTSESRAVYFNNNSPLASASSYAKPTDDSLVRVMSALAGICTKRRQAFVYAAFKQLTCSPLAGVDKAAQTVIIAERIRAELDSKKSMRHETVILRQFFETTHLQASVQRVFVWMDADNEQFQLAQQSQLVPALHNVIKAAAKWRHVSFAVLPVPYAYSLLPTFNSFVHEFNKLGNDQPNVLRLQFYFWLNCAERADGARFTHSLGSNDFVTDFTAVDKMGRVSHKSARAALRFIRCIKPSLVPEDVDLSDPPPEQKRIQPSSSTFAPNLHSVRHGKVQKSNHGNYTSRDAPYKWGGEGGRGSGNNNRRGQGSRRHN
ncbi:hypothetical protein AAVH_10844 [Aphelenchoides avenae]|nr:hypothetical protein AAVH_10844 [Aphelenchus avenae]